MIRFICSSCSEHLAVPEQDGATIGWCHRCRNPYTAPRSTAAIGVMERRQPLPPPPPITIPKPLMIFFVIVAGAILVGSLYAIVDSARSKLPPSARADIPTPQVPPPSNPIPSADATRPEADVNGEPWTFDPQPRIRTSFPLAARYLQKLPTDEFQITPEQVKGTIYFGDPNGRIYAVNPQTLQIEKHKLGNGFFGFSRQGTKLKAALDQPFKFQTIAEFDQPIESGDSDDVFAMGRKLGGYELPKDRLMPAPTVYFRGKYYSCAVGAVKVLDKGVASEFKSPLKNLKFWKIALLPTGPAGFDNWGVFELDEHLCPIKRVINLRNDPNENHITSCLASDGQTLCFVSTGNNTTWMQIWSLDARSKLREIEVPFKPLQSSSRGLFLENSRVIAVGGGYLFSGHNLTWLPPDAKRPVEYNIPLSPWNTQNMGQVERQYLEKAAKEKNFTPAVLANNRIFAGHTDGGLYVFDVAAFTAHPGHSRSAAANP